MIRSGYESLPQTLKQLLKQSRMSYGVDEFRRYGSARKLYNFDIDQVDDY